MALQVMDFRNGFVRLCYNTHGYSQDSVDVYISNVKATHLAAFEKVLGDRRPWLTGQGLCYADFHLYEMLAQHVHLHLSILENFPLLRAYISRFEELPSIVQYRHSDAYLEWPLNNRSAAYGGELK